MSDLILLQVLSEEKKALTKIRTDLASILSEDIPLSYLLAL